MSKNLFKFLNYSQLLNAITLSCVRDGEKIHIKIGVRRSQQLCFKKEKRA